MFFPGRNSLIVWKKRGFCPARTTLPHFISSPKNTVPCVNMRPTCCLRCSSWRPLLRVRSVTLWIPSEKCIENSFVRFQHQRQLDLSLRAGEKWYSLLGIDRKYYEFCVLNELKGAL